MPHLFVFTILFARMAFSKAQTPSSTDPCVSYSTINNAYRSTGYKPRAGIDPLICDDKLQTGWYRFINKVGGKMPEMKIASYHCGTYAPIWMQPPHPATADGIVDKTACMNYNGMNNGCMALSIKVKNCNDHYFVYHLTATFGCPMAYCAGTARPCPRGQSGLWPNCTVSTLKDFPFANVPVPNISYVDNGEPSITLKCSFNFPTWNNVSFKIQWFENGKGKPPETICENPNESRCDIRHSELTSAHFEAGSWLRCNISARYNTNDNNRWTNAVTSPLFFAGIEIRPPYLTVTQCDVENALNKIQLRPTLPIRGGELKVKFGTLTQVMSSLANKCELNLKPGDEDKWHDVSIQAVCDNTNQPLAPSAFTFTVTHTDHRDTFWAFYELPPVVITMVENPVKMCIATGDPHYTTFDGRYYHFYRPGDFVLYRNKERYFEIHTRLWHCGQTVTCNCGVAIRELRDVIVLTSCTEDFQYNYGMPMKVLITSPGQLMRGTQILVRHRGSYSEYVVRLPSGAVVRMKRYSWGNNVELEAPKFDVGKTEGMCGNFDNNPSNDFDHGGDKQQYYTDDSFGESWRVNKSQSLFYNVPQCSGACQDTEAQLNMDRCSCGLNGGALNVTCNLQIMQFKGISSDGFKDKTTDLNNANRKKRDLIYSDDVIYLYDNEKSDQTVYHKRTKRNVPVGMSPENATEYCRKRILDITATKVCLELTGINASSAIQSCAADLQLTGDLNWVESAFESLKSTCEFKAVSNFSAYEKDENGNFVPPVEISQNLCPGDCNSNGNCTNGTCVCNEGFISADCSLRFDEIPRLFRILDRGLCDIRHRPCIRTIVFGEYFVDSKNLTCHINEYMVVPGAWIPSNDTKSLQGRQTDLFAVECQLPPPPINMGNYDVEGTPAAGYRIAVSNDKARHSQFLELITFDSVCQECNISHGCLLKRDSCLIRGHCFAEEAPNPNDWCQQCNISVNQMSWTRRMINFPPNITTPRKRFALLGENLHLQLEGEDPESRPFVISLLAGSPAKAKISDKGVLFWKPETPKTELFFLKATDECNASSTFDLTIEIVACPCTNKGTCKPDANYPRGSGMYFCECQPGYEGQRCEKEINECLSSPCIYGNCSDAVNNYSCQCEPGYTGYNCSIDIDECQSSPCIHGNCSDLVNSFKCTCQSGFIGIRCEINIDDCPSSCGNGTCIDLLNNYTCQCNVGFAGQHCDVIIRNCSETSCFPGVRCIQKTNTILCESCPSGFTGDGKNCKDIDDCANVTCRNDGTCVDGVNSFTCSCRMGYHGDFCETDIDDCANVTCQNGGTCVDGVNIFACSCRMGYHGNFCETDIDDCANVSCQNGGTCVDGINNFTCSCPVGYKGGFCETDIDDCANVTCRNGGTCVDGVNNFICSCPMGYSGVFCEKEILTTVATEGTSLEILSSTTKLSIERMPNEKKSDFTFEIRVFKEWDDKLRDKNSETYKQLSTLLTKEIYKAYSGVPGLKEVKITSMRRGSIMVEFQLMFRSSITSEEALAPLKKVTADGKLGSLKVDPSSLKQKTPRTENGDEEGGNSNLLIIVGISCGSFVVLALLAIFAFFRCKRPGKRPLPTQISDGLPMDVDFSKAESYELRHKITCHNEQVEEKGQWNEGME